MITTSTGAKKLESSDNWREIFPNPGTSAAGAHNASVDAHDRIQAEVAPIINGKRCSLGAASGEYVLLRNSTITGKADGAYQAAKAIPANTDLDSTYLGSPITGGLVNELNSKITTQTTTIADSAFGGTVYVRKSANVVSVSYDRGVNTAFTNLSINTTYTLGTLPSEYRPANFSSFPVMCANGNGNYKAIFRGNIDANGVVSIRTGDTIPSETVDVYMTLSACYVV